MASDSKGWEPISGDKLKAWRRDLPKGHTREVNTARHESYAVADSDGDDAFFTDDDTSGYTPLTELASPREVADEIFGLMWTWAKGSRENFQLMARMIRHNEPDAYGHLSDDELSTKLEQHAKDASRKATENAYDDGWDRGNDLDMWQGKAVTP